VSDRAPRVKRDLYLPKGGLYLPNRGLHHPVEAIGESDNHRSMHVKRRLDMGG